MKKGTCSEKKCNNEKTVLSNKVISRVYCKLIQFEVLKNKITNKIMYYLILDVVDC